MGACYDGLMHDCGFRAEVFRMHHDGEGFVHEMQCKKAIDALLARAEAAEAELNQKEEYYGQMIDALAALDSTDLEETKEKLKAAETELTALRRLQPVQLDEAGANAMMLAAEVSELRQRMEASEARAEKAEKQLREAKKCVSGLSFILKAIDGKMVMGKVLPIARSCLEEYREKYPSKKVVLDCKEEE